MKILLVSNGYPPTSYGGVEVYTHDLARGLVECGHDVSVFCRESDFSLPDYSILHDQGEVEITRVVNDFKNIRTFIETYRDETINQIFKTYIDKKRPDIIHFNHLIGLSVDLPEIARQYGIPVLFTLHDYWSICHRVQLVDCSGKFCSGPQTTCACDACVRRTKPEGSLQTRLLIGLRDRLPFKIRLMIRRVVRGQGNRSPIYPITGQMLNERNLEFKNVLGPFIKLVPSEFVKSLFVSNGFNGDEIKVLPLGIPPMKKDGKPMKSSENDPIQIGFVGTFIPNKGVDVLLKAFKLIPDAHIELKMYGRDDVNPGYMKKLYALAEGDHRINFCGPFPPERRVDYFQQFNWLVVPSLFPETFSFVAREALQLHIPVIASKIGALTEVIRDGSNGFTFDPGNSIQLAEILRKIADAPHLVDAFGFPGVNVLSIPEHVSLISEIYSEVISESKILQ
jgi:glycosyltransferase involved in cell wall biosynthesis